MTDFIGLIGFIPVIVLISIAWYLWDYEDRKMAFQVLGFIILYVITIVGLSLGGHTLIKLL